MEIGPFVLYFLAQKTAKNKKKAGKNEIKQLESKVKELEFIIKSKKSKSIFRVYLTQQVSYRIFYMR